MPAYVSVMLKILDDNKISYSDDIVKTITPLGFKGTAKYFNAMGLDVPGEKLVKKMGEYAYEEYARNIPAKSNVASTLKALKESGASPHITLDICLKRLKLYDLFDNVWSCDDFATTKADKAIYGMAAEKMGVSVEDVLFLDDNLDADTTAKAAGMKVCGVYDKSSDMYVNKIKAATDFYIYDFAELLEIMKA